tara:strand:- start:570 stop:1145 length:576 start_codon:yes stop_codon:yes gene_type:complete
MKKYLTLLSIILSLSSHAQNDVISYNQIHVKSLDLKHNEPNDDRDGYTLKGSYAITDNFYLIAGFDKVKYDHTDQKNDISTVGVGGHIAKSRKTDYVYSITYSKNKIKNRSVGSIKIDSSTIAAGVRSMLSKNIELNGGIEFIKFENESAEISPFVGVDIHPNFANGYALSVTYASTDDYKTLSAGLKYSF